MRTFTLSDLNRRPGELVDKALVEPIVLTKHRRAQLVMLSAEQFERLTGKSLKALNEPVADTSRKYKLSKLSRLRSINSDQLQETDER